MTPTPEPLEVSGHRAFRMLLRELDDNQLAAARDQLELELAGRLDRDQSVFRLLATTLADADVSEALTAVCYEIAERQIFNEFYERFITADPGEAPPEL
jgi:hypothetical protein